MIVLELCSRVIDCDVSDRLDLPELTSIYMGYDAFGFCLLVVSSTLIMRSAKMNVN